MSFETYINIVKHINMEKFNQLSLGAKMMIEAEYNFTYGI